MVSWNAVANLLLWPCPGDLPHFSQHFPQHFPNYHGIRMNHGTCQWETESGTMNRLHFLISMDVCLVVSLRKGGGDQDGQSQTPSFGPRFLGIYCGAARPLPGSHSLHTWTITDCPMDVWSLLVRCPALGLWSLSQAHPAAAHPGAGDKDVSPSVAVAVFRSKDGSARTKSSVTGGAPTLLEHPWAHPHPRNPLHPRVTALAAPFPIHPEFPTA